METGPRIIIACRIMKQELEMICDQNVNVEIRYIDQELHMTPRKIGPAIQQQIDRLAGGSNEIVLGYGLCSNGIVGIEAPAQGLYVPKCHDCIAFFMGSGEKYRAAIKARPGTFYLTAGWVEGRKDPLSYMQDCYVPRMGQEMAEWGMKEELKHYTKFTLINSGAGNQEQLRRKTMENSTFFGKEFDEISGSLVLFEKMVKSPLPREDFFYIQPGEQIRQNMFLDYGKKTHSPKSDPVPTSSSLLPPVETESGCQERGCGLCP